MEKLREIPVSNIQENKWDAQYYPRFEDQEKLMITGLSAPGPITAQIYRRLSYRDVNPLSCYLSYAGPGGRVDTAQLASQEIQKCW